ncbi:hypothetical protein DM02DRAFT_728962 [Periconia macrospinosa]|uniref:Uncharacterized protein n=1 Tax=Periconia macrospinosa TaxID=97972 RepID=A0A2V1DNY2_9PLEO|nr:hypothetical protein DM02DRAFT_728962 [Periconia macrospinosa]
MSTEFKYTFVNGKLVRRETVRHRTYRYNDTTQDRQECTDIIQALELGRMSQQKRMITPRTMGSHFHDTGIPKVGRIQRTGAPTKGTPEIHNARLIGNPLRGMSHREGITIQRVRPIVERGVPQGDTAFQADHSGLGRDDFLERGHQFDVCVRDFHEEYSRLVSSPFLSEENVRRHHDATGGDDCGCASSIENHFRRARDCKKQVREYEHLVKSLMMEKGLAV